eukprot:TRINITY_DN3496_c0_g1_i1.p1 TRINITY_DN3496_c0_g1~~TRINITY_DN3496_c0_g1_i1.p1  ORF type:complete len:529 (-),score=126.70 TRINITY_DN3496_c0_g1_i1:287-1873(-)
MDTLGTFLGSFLFNSSSSKLQVERKYKFLHTVGKGSFSTVKLAKIRNTNQLVAIKVVNKRAASFRQNELEHEICILAEVRHPNIVRLYEFFDTGKECFLVMQYAAGGEVFDRVATRGAYTEAAAREIMRQVVDAVAFLHDKQIVHRDLKPENLLFATSNDDSYILLSDFGFSRFIPADNTMSTSCGTPSYVAPEIVLGLPYTAKVDVWSIGVLTYVLLGGYAPFDEDRTDLTYANIVEGRFSFPDEYWAAVSPLAKDFIRATLQLAPAKRLSAKAALRHPWFTANESDLGNIKHASQMLARYNAKRKMRKVMITIRASKRLALNSRHAAQDETASQDLNAAQDLNTAQDLNRMPQDLSAAHDSSPSQTLHSDAETHPQKTADLTPHHEVPVMQLGQDLDQGHRLPPVGDLTLGETKITAAQIQHPDGDKHAIEIIIETPETRVRISELQMSSDAEDGYLDVYSGASSVSISPVSPSLQSLSIVRGHDAETLGFETSSGGSASLLLSHPTQSADLQSDNMKSSRDAQLE